MDLERINISGPDNRYQDIVMFLEKAGITQELFPEEFSKLREDSEKCEKLTAYLSNSNIRQLLLAYLRQPEDQKATIDDFMSMVEKFDLGNQSPMFAFALMYIKDPEAQQEYYELVVTDGFVHSSGLLEYFKKFRRGATKEISRGINPNLGDTKRGVIFSCLSKLESEEDQKAFLSICFDPPFIESAGGFLGGARGRKPEGKGGEYPKILSYFKKFGDDPAKNLFANNKLGSEWASVLPVLTEEEIPLDSQQEFIDVCKLKSTQRLNRRPLSSLVRKYGGEYVSVLFENHDFDYDASKVLEVMNKTGDKEEADTFISLYEMMYVKGGRVDPLILFECQVKFGDSIIRETFQKYNDIYHWSDFLKIILQAEDVIDLENFLSLCSITVEKNILPDTLMLYYKKNGYEKANELFHSCNFGDNWSTLFQALVNLDDMKREESFLKCALVLGEKRMDYNNLLLYFDKFGAQRTQEIVDSCKDINDVSLLIKNLSLISLEMQDVHVKIFTEIQHTPIPELVRVKNEIIELLTTSLDPLADFKKIESVFIKNNTPSFIKLYQVFNIIIEDETLARNLSNSKSEILKSYKDNPQEAREYLLKKIATIHLESGNTQFYNFARLFVQSEKLIKKSEEFGWRVLSYDEYLTLAHFYRKALSTSIETPFGDAFSEDEDYEGLPLDEVHSKLVKAFGTATLSEAFTKYFFEPLEVSSFEEVIEKMKSVKIKADERRSKTVSSGKFVFEEGDLIKGFKSEFLEKILDNGSVCKEFLGSGASSDATPLDTDTARILPGATAKDMFELASPYGDAFIIIKKSKEFEERHDCFTEFAVSEDGSQYCIAPGFASSYIDGFALTDTSKENVDRWARVLAKKWGSCVLTDTEGNPLISEEEFKKIRKCYQGVDLYFTDDIKLTLPQTDKFKDEVEKSTLSSEESKETNEISKKVATAVSEALMGCGLHINDQEETSLTGCQLMESGSTSRGTGLSKDYDFDFIARLDYKDIEKREDIVNQVKSVVQTVDDSKTLQHSSGDFIQLRLFGVTKIGNHVFSNPVDVDIAFGSRSTPHVYATHDAVNDRFANLEKNYGEEGLECVKTNIKLAKKFLKEYGVYKKAEGYFGGIAVENWILQNNGNLLDAIDSLLGACIIDEKVIPVAEFKAVYPILDPGINLQRDFGDNFSYMIKDQDKFNTFVSALKEIKSRLT